MKNNKTTLQVIADWLAIDNKKNNKIFKIRTTKKILLIERTIDTK